MSEEVWVSSGHQKVIDNVTLWFIIFESYIIYIRKKKRVVKWI